MENDNTGSGRAPTLFEQIQKMQKDLKALGADLQLVKDQTRDVIGGIAEAVNAIIALNGTGFDQRVQEEIVLARQKRGQEQAAQNAKVVDDLIAAGAIVSTTTVTEDSILVVKEVNKNGDVLGVGRTPFEYRQLTDAKAKEFFLGKQVGAVFEAETGTVEVLEIYVLGDVSTKTSKE